MTKPSEVFRPDVDQPVSWLAGMTPRQFMRRHWQKKPLLVRQAFPGFVPPICIDEALALCSDDLAPSRLVRRQPRSGRWTLEYGPFPAERIPGVSRPNWTVLIQQVNTRLNAADRFLDAFRFIPQARLDDLMISVAGPGGGIGAHVDSYDVFLVQAAGRRRWEIAERFDTQLEDDVPLRILRQFNAEQEWVLEPGDLLYLPPGVAHRGTAIGPGCMTWSVGFRAPDRTSLADAALSRHIDGLAHESWHDPWLAATDRPAQIPARLLEALTRQVMRDLPDAAGVRRAIARLLSEPAPEAVFDAPRRPDSEERFMQRATARGIRLAPATRLLYTEGTFSINGEEMPIPRSAAERRALEALADARWLSPNDSARLKLTQLYEAYQAGWIVYN
jgi:50S ribosomal protein L16 3-hydroxylase